MKVLFFQLVALIFILGGVRGSNTTDDRKHYIVYMGSHSFPDHESLISSNHELLSSVIGSLDEAKSAIIYHYYKSFRGFSTVITPQQANQISKKDNVVKVLENQLGHLDTTRSWDFMGAPAKSIFSIESNKKDYDVIVGHFDSGIWPESQSFREDGLGPVPRRWRGECSDSGCSRKVIGYRWYSSGFVQDCGPIETYGGRYYLSARDDFGHGTHTASTAVGTTIRNVNLKGMGTHDLRGGAPGARLAVYKICWFDICSCADALKAYDDAIYDGVDAITMSVGNDVKNNKPGFLDDCFALGALHAFQRGVLVSASGGNDGDAESLANAAPWMLTVGASSIDREFVTPLQLGNSLILRGRGYNQHNIQGYHGLVYARYAALSWDSSDAASTCKENSLNVELIWGKIVVCNMENNDDDNENKANVVKNLGGAGVIIIDPYGDADTSMDFVIPTALIDEGDANELFTYMSGSWIPTAHIYPHETQLNTKPAPRVAMFSSKGPGSAPDIIKPDITGPGLNILASWPAWDEKDASTPLFEIDSGTSMSCPHASGVAALIKGTHRHWSPAAIKSALMTTASYLDNTGNVIRSGGGKATPFDMGSGHLNPTNAINPGLIYDYNMTDLIVYLCNIENTLQIGDLLDERVSCSSSHSRPTYDLNYPSIGISNLQGSVIVTRTATYVGQEGDPKIFYVKIENPQGISLQVAPSVLDFSHGQRTATYTVKVRAEERLRRYVFGSITWFNDVHSVRSPVAIRTF